MVFLLSRDFYDLYYMFLGLLWFVICNKSRVRFKNKRNGLEEKRVYDIVRFSVWFDF